MLFTKLINGSKMHEILEKTKYFYNIEMLLTIIKNKIGKFYKAWLVNLYQILFKNFLYYYVIIIQWNF